MDSLKYSDLVVDDGAIQKLIADLGNLKQTYEADIKAIIAACQQMKAAMNGVGGGNGNTAALAQQASEIDKLKAKYDELNGRYKSNNLEIEKYKAKIAELKQEMKAEAKAQLENTQGLKQAQESYNRLAALYTKLKIELNKYSQAEIDSTAALKAKQQQAEATMAKMKALQAATGRHTLDVGNYSKALNGLGLATQQIVREMPSLAMSANQFFLAISNNIPIFMDNFRRVEEELGSTRAALKATFASLFSGQTALIIIITLLSKFGDKLPGLIKQLLGIGQSVDVAAQSLSKYRTAMQSVAKGMGESAAELSALIAAVERGNLTSKQEADVIQYVNEQYADQIRYLGVTVNNTQSLIFYKNQLVDVLLQEAKANGVLNKITEVSGQIAEREASEERLKLIEKRTESEQYLAKLKKVFNKDAKNYSQEEHRQMGQAILDLNDKNKAVAKYDEQTQVLYATLERLRALIPTLKLDLLTDGGGKGQNWWDGIEIGDTDIPYTPFEIEIVPILQHDKIKRSLLDAQYKFEQSQIRLNLFGDAKEMNRQLKEAEIAYKKKILDQWEKEGFSLTYEFMALRNEIELLKKSAEEEAKMSWFEKLRLKITSIFDKRDLKDISKAIKQAANYVMEQFQEIAAARVELAEQWVEASEKELEATKSVLDQEIEARSNGYANNVALAQQEYLEKQRINEQALAEQEAATAAQERLNTVQQAMSLVTASAQIFASLSSIPYVGIPLAISLIATMLGAFVAAKTQVAQLTATTYGEGGTELLMGGSHQSGNDIPLGTMPDGSERRAEGGEYLAIINKRSSRKYGALIPAVVDALNAGVFEQKYGNAFSGNGGDIVLNVDGSADAIESFHRDMKAALSRRNETRLPDGTRIITYGHTRKIIRS